MPPMPSRNSKIRSKTKFYWSSLEFDKNSSQIMSKHSCANYTALFSRIEKCGKSFTARLVFYSAFRISSLTILDTLSNLIARFPKP